MTSKTKKPRRIRSSRPFNALFGAGFLVLSIALLLVLLGSKESAKVDRADSLVNFHSIKIDVPSRQIYKGERLSEVPFTSVEWPSNSDISSFAQSRAQLSTKYAKSQLTAFSPVPLNATTDSSAEANAVVEGIPQGFRAISVKVDVESSVEGWAQTGNFVDVIVLRQSGDPELGIEAKVIAENVKILSTGSTVEQVGQSSNAVRPPPTVTLLVSAEDALKIRTASTLGKLTFSLRGLGDDSSVNAISMNQKTLLGENKTNYNKPKDLFKGQARGPDGKLYVLDSDSKWVKDIKELSSSTRE